MSMMKLIDIVKNHKARFVRYQNEELWYVTDNGFEFPVPIKSLGGSLINYEENAMLLMVHIRAHLKMLAKAKTEQSL